MADIHCRSPSPTPNVHPNYNSNINQYGLQPTVGDLCCVSSAVLMIHVLYGCVTEPTEGSRGPADPRQDPGTSPRPATIRLWRKGERLCLINLAEKFLMTDAMNYQIICEFFSLVTVCRYFVSFWILYHFQHRMQSVMSIYCIMWILSPVPANIP